MFRKPWFWAALTIASLASGVVAVQLFPQAFPLVRLELTMDREAALAAAQAIAARDGIGPADARQAASFAADGRAQTFVELEGGGKDAYAAMLRDGLYSVYTWRVRQFQEGEKREALIRFRPDGRPYGFVEQIEEAAPGAAIEADAARALAEQAAGERWAVDLSAYALVETSRERRTGGRVDHTFTYERASPALGDGRIRLRLVVSGDRLTAVSHFIRIPEAFSRRYEAMRSANSAIGVAGSMAMMVLYVAGGVGIGLFWLLRRRAVLARTAIQWGVGIAFLQLLAGVNAWPLMWMSYDTALSRASFISQQGTLLLASFAGTATLVSLSFMAAESLTRRAFGHHPQLWQVWSRPAAASTTVLGGTIAGYLLVPMFFAYDVLLYLYATRWFGWWTPSEALIQPDILATPLPWLPAIANSLQAGFWEEALFRAVPIAGAALIGDRFGKRGPFIVAAFVIQAAVFGAGHAPYPTQPSYARPVELILPSIGFGLLYLRFGLLPGIVLHYAFDVVWMAMPLFVSDAGGVWLDRAIVIALTAIPIAVVISARLREGRFAPLPAGLRNAAWSPPPEREHLPAADARPATVPMSASAIRAWAIAGVVALLVWAAARPPALALPPIAVSRVEAARLAREALAARGVSLGPSWRVLPAADAGLSEAHQYAWETGGRERVEALAGRYLTAPRWQVRVVSFEGDVASRAEEWVVTISARGEVEEVVHRLPESAPGAALNEAEARARAVAAIGERLQQPASSLRDVSAVPSKLAARTDWRFTFQDVTVDPLPLPEMSTRADGAAGDSRGEARIRVDLAGDEVVRVEPFLHVPDAWQRDQRTRQTIAQVVSLLATLLAIGALLSAAMEGLIAWSRGQAFDRSAALAVFGVFAITAVVAAVNRWPSALASMSTAQSFELQAATLAGVGLVGLFLPAAAVGLAAGTVPASVAPTRALSLGQLWLLGGSLGLIAAAVAAVSRLAGAPVWPDVSALTTYLPVVAALAEPVAPLLLRSMTLLALVIAVDEFTHGWTIRRATFGAALVVAGALLLAPSPASLPLPLWAAAAAAAGVALWAAYVFLVRHHLLMAPIAVATMAVVDLMGQGLRGGYDGSMPGALAAVVAVAVTAGWLVRRLAPPTDREAAKASP